MCFSATSFSLLYALPNPNSSISHLYESVSISKSPLTALMTPWLNSFNGFLSPSSLLSCVFSIKTLSICYRSEVGKAIVSDKPIVKKPNGKDAVPSAVLDQPTGKNAVSSAKVHKVMPAVSSAVPIQPSKTVVSSVKVDKVMFLFHCSSSNSLLMCFIVLCYYYVCYWLAETWSARTGW